MLEDTQVALIDLEKVMFYFLQFEGEPLVASTFGLACIYICSIGGAAGFQFNVYLCLLLTCRHANVIPSGGHASERKGFLLP